MIYIVTTHAREFIPLKYEMKATPLTTSLVSFPSNHLDSKSLVCFLLFFFFFKSPTRISDECLRLQLKDVA